MEHLEGAQTPFEVYCDDCRVTFPIGTSRCVHCGQRLGRPQKSGSPGMQDVEAEMDASNPLRRAGGISLWVLIAVGAALARMCNGQ